MADELDNGTENAGEIQKPHLFQKGKSGNPAGKPKGTRNHATRALDVLFDGEAEGLSRKAIEMALAGDIQALRICLDRILPPRRDRHVSLELPQIRTIEDVAAGLGIIVEAVADGAITPAEGSAVAGLLQNYSDAIQLTDLTRRLEILEERANL